MRFRPLMLPWLLGVLCAAPALCAPRAPLKPAVQQKRTGPVVKKAAPGPARAVARGRRVAGRASGLVGASLAPYRVPDDCSGLVRLAYQYVGVELLSHGLRPGENAASAIYRRARLSGALHRHTPRPGDIVFFRETYDRNGDGMRNDGLTHVGVIETVERDGTVVFVHRGSGGVGRSRMNLRQGGRRARDGHVVNDYLRRAEGGQRARLTRELFAGYGSAGRM